MSWPYSKIVADLKESSECLGGATVFCYPFGHYNDNAKKAVKDAGFRVAFVGGYRKSSRSDDKYKIPRYPIQDYTTLNQFISIVN